MSQHTALYNAYVVHRPRKEAVVVGAHIPMEMIGEDFCASAPVILQCIGLSLVFSIGYAFLTEY